MSGCWSVIPSVQPLTVDITTLTPMQTTQPSEVSIAPSTDPLAEIGTLELAQALAARLTITPDHWHRLKSNRNARASEQAAAALVYLLKNQPEEALPRFQQASGWLDRSISAPPCPDHGK